MKPAEEVLKYINPGTIFQIYEIVGKKVGVSINPKARVRSQGASSYVILEEHSDIFEVSKRELELQKEKGYRVDLMPYWLRYFINTTETVRTGNRHGGLIAGIIAKETGQLLKAASLAGISRWENDKERVLAGLRKGNLSTNTKNMLCEDGHLSTPASYKRYCDNHGLDHKKTVKINGIL